MNLPKYSNYKITSTLEFTNSFHIIPDLYLSFGYGSISLYIHFLNFTFHITIYWDLSAWNKPRIYLSTPSLGITKFYNTDSTYLYYFDICWYGLIYRKSFWQINELNDKYPYDKELYVKFTRQDINSLEEFSKQMEKLQKETEKIFSKKDDNSD